MTEWYQENRRRQVRCWGVVGCVFGTFLGKSHRFILMSNADYGDHILISEYSIEKEHVSEFERCWNDHAKMTQRHEGYIGTKLFKALNRDWPKNDEEEEDEEASQLI